MRTLLSIAVLASWIAQMAIASESAIDSSTVELMLLRGDVVNDVLSKSGARNIPVLQIGDTIAEARTKVPLDKLDDRALSARGRDKQKTVLALIPKGGTNLCWSIASVTGDTAEYMSVFAAGEDGAMRLVDLLALAHGAYRPLRDGVLNKNLHRLRPGMTIDNVFALVGYRTPAEYYKHEEHGYVVLYRLPALSGSYDLLIDAANGVVIDVVRNSVTL